MDSPARKLHSEAAQARENGEFAKSLALNDEALLAYEAENDSLGFAEAIACRSITLRVYANLHQNKRLLVLAKHEMMAAVDIAQESGDPKAIALPLYNLAQVQEDLGDASTATETYKQAVTAMQKNPPENHNRPSVLANMQIHLFACAYKTGDTAALEQAKQALSELEAANEISTYSKDVWVSGGYMRLAEAVKTSDREAAKIYLAQAKKIIDANSALILRRQQWELLAVSLK